MDEIKNKAIIQYLDLLKKEYSDIDSVYLFGSYAKGTSTDDSDIDLALVFKNLEDSKRFDIQVQLMMLAAKIDSRIEPHPISLDDFESGNPFVIEIRRTGVKLPA